MLENCPNIEVSDLLVSSKRRTYLPPKSLDIAYSSPRNQSVPPSAHELLLLGRWPHLTSLALTNLRPSTGFDAMTSFLGAHPNIETLHLDLAGRNAHMALPWLPPNTLPHLRDLRSTRELANTILSSPCDKLRPLESVRGMHLSTSEGSVDTTLLSNLRKHRVSLRRIELAGWNEIDDLRQLVEAASQLTLLDVGKRSIQSRLSHGDKNLGPVNNSIEWAMLLSSLPNLLTFHGVRFFYEISNAVLSVPLERLTTADRSRVKKNEEVASVLAWKCSKLRRVDHWEDGSGKVIVLVRDKEKDKVRWEVRRVKQMGQV